MNNNMVLGQETRIKLSVELVVLTAMTAAMIIGALATMPQRTAAAGFESGPSGATGSGWIPDVLISGTGNDHNPQIVTANNGDLLLVYEEGGASRDLYFTRSSDSGISWLTPLAVASTASDEATPDIATDPFSGRIFISYLVGNTGLMVIYSDDGVTWNGGTTGFTCSTVCDPPRLAVEYWNGASNMVYFVTSTQLSASDWNVGVFGSVDHGGNWGLLFISGMSATDIRANPEVAVQHGSDGKDRIFMTYRTGAAYPGDAGCIDWSEDYGANWLGPNCNMVNVATPIVIAAAHDGSTTLRAYGAVSPVDQIAWVVDDIDPSGITAWDWWPGLGYNPALSVDGEGQTDVTTGGNYHMMARDTADMLMIYGSAPVGMTSNIDWSPIVKISDSNADGSGNFPLNTITTQLRSGTWYPVASWCDYRYFQWDIRVTTPGAIWQFDTVPANLDITIDGGTYVAPVIQVVVAGAVHIVDTPSPQSGGTGMRYVWSSWSDTGAQVHMITGGTVDTTLTANFNTEYEVTIDSAPTGLNVALDAVIQTTNTSYWVLGGIHTISTPSPQAGPPGSRQVFSAWSDAGAQTHDITVSGPMFFLATFNVEYLVTVDSLPTGLNVSIDGMTQTTNTSFWVLDGVHTIATMSPQNGPPGIRYVFSSWSDAGSQTHDITVSGPMFLLATFDTQYLVTVDSMPTGLNVTIDSTTQATNASFWVTGGIHAITAPSPQPGASGTRYVFSSWSDAGSQTHDITVSGPMFLFANFDIEYRITIDTSPTGLNVTFDGTTTTAPATFWRPPGSYNLSVASPQYQNADRRHTFASWSDSGARSHDVSVTGPTDLTATFTTSYLLTVVSAHGNVIGDGWYDSGDTATLAANATVAGSAGTRYAFTSWSGDATGTAPTIQVLMNAPKTVTANWVTQYQLTVTTDHGTVTGGGWHNSGVTVTLTLSAIEVSEGGKTWQFKGWGGDASGTALTVDVLMSGPKSVTTSWEEKPGTSGLGATDMTLYAILIIVIVVVILLLVLMMRRRKKRQTHETAQMPPPPPPQTMPPGQQPLPAPPPPQQWPPQQPPRAPP